MDHGNLGGRATRPRTGPKTGPQAGPEARAQPIWAPELDALFWPLSRLGVESAWVSHVPFAHWLVATHRPSVLVELGTHTGVSYSAFCEAVQRAKVDCSCLAFDTWVGDDHSGRYGEEVYADLREFHDARYSAFSQLTRCTFDAGVAYVADGSIDLLHIDGLHTYEAVDHDFRTWQPKLSQRAIVLFHDVNERARDFGAWRLWNDLRAAYPSFTFLHGHGLGVLAVGPSQGKEIRALTALSCSQVHAVRERFSFLGDRWNGWMEKNGLLRHIDNLNRLRVTEVSEKDGLLRHIEHLDTLRSAETSEREGLVRHAAHLDELRTAAASERDGLVRHVEHLNALRTAEALEREELVRRVDQAETLRTQDAARAAGLEARIAALTQELAAARAEGAAAAATHAVLRERVEATELGAKAMQVRASHLEALLGEMLADAAPSGAAVGP